MAAPLFLSENFFNPIAFPAHVLTASEQAVGFEAFHVGRGERSAFSYWTGVTPNLLQTLTVQCDRVRAANCLVIDRGHNLGGLPIFLQISDDATVWQTLLPGGGSAASPTGLVIPATSQPNTLTDTTYGVTTLEGAWGCYFPTPANGAIYWRLSIPAMGTGLIPQIVGLYLGTAYVPYAGALYLPWGEDQDQLVATETMTGFGWRGVGQHNQVKSGSAMIRLQSPDEYDLARYHLQDLFGAGRPTWICYDLAQGDRLFLARRPANRLGFLYKPDAWPQQAELNYVEHEPALP